MFFIAKWLSLIAFVAPLCAAQIKGGDLPDTLNGPSSRDRIAIVGGGAAGIHMAHLLKKKGFNNVKVFEASESVGGQAGSFSASDENGNSVDYDPNPWLQGRWTNKHTWSLLEELGVDEEVVPVRPPTIHEPSMSMFLGNSLINAEWWTGYQIFISQSEEDVGVFRGIFENWCRSRRSCRDTTIDGRNEDFRFFSFVYLQEVLVAMDLLLDFNFGSDERYQQYMIPTFKEGGDASFDLSLPVEDFFNNIEVPREIAPLLPFEILFSVVKPVYELLLSSVGYGSRSAIPTYYMLSYIDAPAITKLVTLDADYSPDQSLSLIKGGFQKVFEELVKKDDIEVETLSEVVGVSAGRRGGFIVRSKDNSVFSRGRTSSENFDFVISAIDAKKFSSMAEDIDTSDVDAAMSCTIDTYWRVTHARATFDEENPRVGAVVMPSIKAAFDDSEGKVRGPLAAMSLPMGKNDATEEEYVDTATRDVVLYETNYDRSISTEEAFDPLPFITVDTVYDQVEHDSYFRRSIDFNSCSPYQVLPGQGKDNVWYIGGSVHFDNVESIINYNQMMVDKFCADSRECSN